ncbi:MAG: Single-stranded-DNA-specific exonuclease RecJ [Candidatus Moranbacteria bacterium GW2011_GWE1_49_15]|nr:MAG: Single-stranded-DNA-specific exonuclease RecJ [Candidatus Moranbacteria bacterium GW2011_GWE2_47_10]KKW06656.1 MAG: Single-stranded-DNA-specific exonuclease RecJ [Candidatus Moranbacteria bacterium GW2011_GWE1_49_15]HBP00709.1 single-stranded-DNA-specific exonuclease RecJ [Candidatus Moranbacteria bacterium]
MNWKIKEKINTDISHGSDLPAVLVRLLAGRGIEGGEEIRAFLDSDYEKNNHDPFLFSDMEKAVERIRKACNEGEKVVIFGDYDADGITSSVILKETLEQIGIAVSVYIPDKKSEGYGLNGKAVAKLAEKGIKLIVTVDCGITGIKEVEKAQELGVDVIITDHHHVPEVLPKALAIINPRIEGCGYPFLELAGVGVAFKLAQALFERLLPEKKDHTKWLLDLVAVGTVADCVPLVGENRIFVKYGLLVLSKTKRTGFQQLFSVARLNIDENNLPSTRNIGYHIAPRINAAGRINHANLAYDLLVEGDVAKSRAYALELEDNNSSRQKITETVTNEVKVLAENMFKDKKLIFAVGENFPIGVVGLVAGKIVQQFNKPTAVLQKGETESKGSFRSIPQVNIIEAIEKCQELLIKFGGHSQAAGISIENGKLEAFYEKLNAQIEKELEGKDISPELLIDAEVSAEELDFSLAEGLEKCKPFGEGNPEPVFVMRGLSVENLRTIGNGEKHLKFSLKAQGSPKILEAVGFYLAKEFAHIRRGDLIDAAFNLQKDEWNGNRRIQLMLIDLKSAGK